MRALIGQAAMRSCLCCLASATLLQREQASAATGRSARPEVVSYCDKLLAAPTAAQRRPKHYGVFATRLWHRAALARHAGECFARTSQGSKRQLASKHKRLRGMQPQ